jgi:enoyl-CoA hydratase
MTYETLLIEKEDGVAVVKLNRLPVNSLNATAYDDLYRAFSELEADDTVGAIVLTSGSAKAFGVGLDIKEVAGKSVAGYLAFVRPVRMTMDKIASVSKPTVAAVWGFALGGGLELALACDMMVAASDAVIGLPEVNLGIMPGAGGTQRLARLVGPRKAKELALTGENISGDEAYRIGLVNKSVPKEDVLKEALTLAKKIAAKPRLPVTLIKSAVDTGLQMDLASAISFENESFTLAYVSEDGREGMAAFAEKRKPNFKGR